MAGQVSHDHLVALALQGFKMNQTSACTLTVGGGCTVAERSDII